MMITIGITISPTRRSSLGEVSLDLEELVVGDDVDKGDSELDGDDNDDVDH